MAFFTCPPPPLGRAGAFLPWQKSGRFSGQIERLVAEACDFPLEFEEKPFAPFSREKPLAVKDDFRGIAVQIKPKMRRPRQNVPFRNAVGGVREMAAMFFESGGAIRKGKGESVGKGQSFLVNAF